MNPSPTKSSRLPVVLTLALGLLAAAFTIVLVSSRAEQQQLKRRVDELQAQLESANAKAAPRAADIPAPVKADTLPPATAAAPAGPPEAKDAAAPNEAATASRRRQANETAAMLKNPMMQKIMASQTATVMQTTYGQLMNKLDLTPEERDHLLGLLVEKQTNLQNLGMQLMNPSLSAEERTGILEQLKGAWTAGEAKIQEFLNDEKDYAYYQTYNQQEPERREVGMFEASLPKDTPLDPTTADALATLQNEHRKKFPFTVDFYDQQNFGNANALNADSVKTFLDEQTRFQAQVADDAARILSPAQLEAYRKNQTTVQQMTAMQLNTIVQLTGNGP